MKGRELNYRFHNPNPEAQTADYIAKLFIEVDKGKVEQAVQQATQDEQAGDEDEIFTLAM